MQKWGRNKSGSYRFRCLSCASSATRKRPDITSLSHQKLYENWLLNKLTLTDFGIKYGVSRRTLDRWFKPFRDKDITPIKLDVRGGVLIIDGYCLQRGATVLIAQTTSNKVVNWSFTCTENFETWLEFFNNIPSFPRVIVCDGQKGMLKAIKLRWPGIAIQRCQFHVIHHVNILLTKKPETRAAQKLKIVVQDIINIKTRDDLKIWLVNYKHWHLDFGSFLKEKTYQADNLTLTGRPKWHYTHGRLHAAHSHLKNALPKLFSYLRYPQIPNTTNFVEGAINSQMQEKLRQHRGLTLSQRRVLIAHFLVSKQR